MAVSLAASAPAGALYAPPPMSFPVEFNFNYSSNLAPATSNNFRRWGPQCHSVERVYSRGIWLMLSNVVSPDSIIVQNDTSRREMLMTDGRPLKNEVNVDEDGNALASYEGSAQPAGLMDEYKNYMLPVLLWQILLIFLISRSLAWCLSPIRQPRVIAEILTGFILSPNVLDKIVGGHAGRIIFPSSSNVIYQSFGYMGLHFFIFITGVDFDITVLSYVSKKSALLAAATTVIPFFSTLILCIVTDIPAPVNINRSTFIFFLACSVSVTAFPVVARLLTELKLYNKDIGRLVLPAALVTDLMAWLLLAISMVLPTSDKHMSGSIELVTVLLIVLGITFVLVCCLIARPTMCWVVRNIPEGEQITNFHIGLVLAGMMFAGILTDAIGFHSVLGVFVFGLVVPRGPLSIALLGRLKRVVMDLMLPMFFVNLGSKIDLGLFDPDSMEDGTGMIMVMLVVLLATAAKAGSGLLLSRMHHMKVSESLLVGLLMSTKGPVEFIILNLARQKLVFNSTCFSLLLGMTMLITVIVTILSTIYLRPSRFRADYKQRNLEAARSVSMLRMVTCVYTVRNVPSLISLLHISNPTKRSPIFVFPVHLIQLTGHASAMLIVHNTNTTSTTSPASSKTSNGPGTANRQSEQIFAAFGNYEQHAGGVVVQPLSAISPYNTIHEDIFSIAEERLATLVVLPFHKIRTPTGEMEEPNPAVRDVNRNLLQAPPCSVGILIDRGLNAAKMTANLEGPVAHHVAVLFFGGPDDREALAYACRMADHPAIALTVIRFVLAPEVNITRSNSLNSSETRPIKAAISIHEVDMQGRLDDECIKHFRLRYLSDNSVMYTEKTVVNSEDTVTAVNSMDGLHDMYLVGRKQGSDGSVMLAGLSAWCEYPELGPLGDLLVTTEFKAPASVLVIQQYVGEDVDDTSRVPSPRESTSDELHHGHKSKYGSMKVGW